MNVEYNNINHSNELLLNELYLYIQVNGYKLILTYLL